MDHAFRFTAEKIRKRIALVEAHRFRAVRPLAAFHLAYVDGPGMAPDLTGPLEGWDPVPPGTYWAGGDRHFTLRSQFDLPQDWSRPALHLPFGSIGDIFNHPEALVYLDGRIIGSVDRHHATVDVFDLPAGRHEIALHGWTGLAGWPPRADAPDRLLMRPCQVVDRNAALDDLLVLATCALETADLAEAPVRDALLDALDAAFLVLDTRHPLAGDLHASAPEALATLQAGLDAAGPPMQAVLTAIGHAHMDIAYLWTVDESRQKNARTYANVLRLMERYPDYHFTHSQPQLYDYTRQDFPEIFDQITARVAEGRWEPIGGMWVEPDTNMPGAEALVRQVLLGRRWFRDQFGAVETPILWLPDTFGFAWCLPQLMQLSGLDMLVTNKLNWNQHNPMPASSMRWQGMDGSEVLLHVLTTPREVLHLPFPTNYKSDLSGVEVKGTVTNATQPALPDLPICYGFGDGGGGPTAELIERARAFAKMPGMPQMRMRRAEDLLTGAKAVAGDLPLWTDELYMEGHRGVLTSQGWLKRANRQAEARLHRVEALQVLTGVTQQSAALTEAWQLLCLNQFHDTLAGTAITQVFDDARRDFARITTICDAAEAAALPKGSGPLTVWNPSPLPRHDLALIPIAPDRATTQPLPEGVTAQPVREGQLVALPPLAGYATAELAPDPPRPLSIQQSHGATCMENTLLRVDIGPDGTLHRVTDKTSGLDLLAPGARGNQLWAYEDRPLSWDAWDIDPFFEDRGEEITDVSACEITETGPLRVALRITRRYRASTITQDIRLTDRSARLDIATQIDWHERHILLKAAFPMAVTAPEALYDIQWGQIARPTTRDTRRDASRFEVCGHKWAALQDGSRAVALLNDGKYGHDTHGNTMRLTLVKSATMPDPEADQGLHEFTYALFPQTGAGVGAIRAEAEALNAPVLLAPGLADLAPPVTVADPSVIIETLKPSEDGAGYVLRLYESEGRATRTHLHFAQPPARVTEVDLLEDPLRLLPIDGARLPLDLRPFQILSLLVCP